MPFWSGDTLEDVLPQKRIIRPFLPKQIDCAAYTLRMGEEAYITPEYDQAPRFSKHTKIRLDHRQHFVIPAGQFGFLLTHETIHMPPNVLGFISLKAGIKFKGLINVSGFHVDPGFEGHLVYAVYNAGPSAIHLEQGQDLFLIWFAPLDVEADETDYSREGKPRVENISPQLIEGIHSEILSLQALNKRLDEVDQTLFRIKAVAAILTVALGLAFGVLRFFDFNPSAPRDQTPTTEHKPA